MSRNYNLLMMGKSNAPSELATSLHFRYNLIYTKDKKSKDVVRTNILPDSYISM